MSDEKVPLAKQPKTLALIIAGLAVGITGLAIVGWLWAGSPRLDLAQWLPAVASVATFLAAVLAAVFAAGAFRVEMAREDRWYLTQVRAQADQVGVWGETQSQYSRILGDNDKLQASTKTLIHLTNLSGLPIYEPQLTATVKQTTIEGSREAQVSPTRALPPALGPGEVLDMPMKHLSTRMADSEAAKTALDASPLNPQGNRELQPEVELTILLRFRDVQGIWWVRDGNGHLLRDTSI